MKSLTLSGKIKGGYQFLFGLIHWAGFIIYCAKYIKRATTTELKTVVHTEHSNNGPLYKQLLIFIRPRLFISLMNLEFRRKCWKLFRPFCQTIRNTRRQTIIWWSGSKLFVNHLHTHKSTHCQHKIHLEQTTVFIYFPLHSIPGTWCIDCMRMKMVIYTLYGASNEINRDSNEKIYKSIQRRCGGVRKSSGKGVLQSMPYSSLYLG